MTAFAWTEDRVDLLKVLWAEKLSASAIAERLGAPTRNTVLGKINRLGMSVPRPPPKPKPPKQPRVAVRGPVNATRIHELAQAAASPMPAAEPPGAHNCGLLDLRNTSCRWIVSGDGPPYRFCGAPDADVDKGVPYCREHMRMGYRRPGEREEAA